MHRRLPALALALAIPLLASCRDAVAPAPLESSAPVGAVAVGAALVARDTASYIVLLSASEARVDDHASAVARAHGGQLSHVYRAAVRGFAGRFTAAQAAAMARRPDVVHVELDGTMTVDATQANAVWGLDRIDQRSIPLNGAYSYNATGAGVNVYIIDTGIRTTHVEFGGRATGNFTSIGDGNGANDCNGHGTHVAGTVGGTTYGVAKAARLYAVRVLGCSGSGATSGVIAGVDWVTANHVKPAVANMSLGGAASEALDQAVRNSIAAGVTYSLAAGNSGQDACFTSPSRVQEALTVGATASSDARASFSNFGGCLDVFAPGVGIASAYAGSDVQVASLNGTSMAAPHVAGGAALYLQTDPGASPGTVAGALLGNATSGVVSGAGTGSPNRLLYTAFIGGGGGGTPNQAPVARFTVSCNASFICTLDGRSSSDDNGIVSYAWNLGKSPGGTASGALVTTTYPHAGLRTVTLTVTDAGGLTSSVTQTFEAGGTPPVNQAPVASFTASCTNLSCTFDGSASTDDAGVTTRSWSFGDGTTLGGNQAVASRTYAAGGTYTVTLTVGDAAGLTNTTTRVVTVSAPAPVNQAPVANFTVSCGAAFTCTLDARSSTDDQGITAYEWNLGKSPGGYATGALVTTTYPHGGSRTVTLTVRDAGGLTATKTVTFNVP